METINEATNLELAVGLLLATGQPIPANLDLTVEKGLDQFAHGGRDVGEDWRVSLWVDRSGLRAKISQYWVPPGKFCPCLRGGERVPLDHPMVSPFVGAVMEKVEALRSAGGFGALSRPYEWEDGMKGQRGRYSYLFLITKNGEIVRFSGKSIPGIVGVETFKFVKQGAWSYTAYALRIGAGVRTWEFFHGVRPAEYGGWDAAYAAWINRCPPASATGCKPSLTQFQSAWRQSFPNDAAKWDEAPADDGLGVSL